MARTSPSALMEHLLPKLTEFYHRGRPAIYQQQVDDNENNNYSYNNNNIIENDREVGIFNAGHQGLKVWQMITKNIMGVNCLYSHTQRNYTMFKIRTKRISPHFFWCGVSGSWCCPCGAGLHGRAHWPSGQLVHPAWWRFLWTRSFSRSQPTLSAFWRKLNWIWMKLVLGGLV